MAKDREVDEGEEQRAQYEYRTIEIDGDLEDVLNQHGEHGWRFVDAVDGEAVFERVAQPAVVRTIAKRDGADTGWSFAGLLNDD